MKKVSLLSLLTVLALSTAANANVEDPLYAPVEGKLYSKTSIERQKSFFSNDYDYSLTQKFGYGLTNRIVIDGSINYIKQDNADDGFGSLNIGGSYKLTSGPIISALYAHYEEDIDEDIVGNYSRIEAGLKLGKRFKKSTIVAKTGIDHFDFKDIDEKENNLFVDLEGMYTFDDRISANLGLKYTIIDNDIEENTMALRAQVNYQKAGLWSLYYTTELKDDTIEDILGLKYGIQF